LFTRGSLLVRFGSLFCAAFLLAGQVGLLHASEAATVLRCTLVEEAGNIRQLCAQNAVTDRFSVELPQDIQPVETGSLLNSIVKVPLPDVSSGEVSLSPDDLRLPPKVDPAPATAQLPDIRLPTIQLPLPDLPPPAMIPQQGPPASASPSLAINEPTKQLPAEVLQQALKKLNVYKALPDRDARSIVQFYASRGFAPIWIENGQWGAAAKAARKRLAQAGEDGLDPGQYRSVSAFLGAGEPQWPALAAAEVQLSEAVVRYSRDAAIGRIDPSRVHEFITPTRLAPDPDQVLSAVSSAADADVVLQAFNPPHKAYRALRQKLAELRRIGSEPVGESIPDGPALRMGMRDARVPLIRARLGLGYDSAPVYDRSISIKVAGLQKTAGLPVNGMFTPQTRRALLGELPSADEVEIIANMERWRWLPRDLGADHIFVNVPELSLELQRAGKVVHSARIIIGKSDTQTPVFSDMMDHIVVHPSWFVPPAILKKDPRYLDPAWTEARGYTLIKRGDVVTVRVPPSASNALGNVKFMFPNQHAVYLHDTPGRHLFNARNRLLSNGCVRVENPFRLAAALFDEDGWSEERFKKQIGGAERMMKLRRKLPIHIAYFTLTIDDSGQLLRHTDVYGHSLRLRQLLGLS
jgi:L,D-transpeptidase YcbB